MGAPIATSSDLESFMGMASGTIDATRATLILGLAQDLCEAVVTPLPTTAKVVVLAVAARGFANPEGVLTETVGPYTVQRGAAALFLAKSDNAHLRRISGRTGAFSIDTLPVGTSAVQLISILGSPTGGTFTLSFFGVTTAPLAFSAMAAAIQAALEALGPIQTGNVAVSGTGPFTVTFQNDLATTPVPTIIATSALTGGTAPSVTVSIVTTGIYAPGQGLAPWDYDYTGGRRQIPPQI